MTFRIDASSLRGAGDRYTGAAASLQARLAAQLPALRSQVEYIGVGEIRAVTPTSHGRRINESWPGWAGGATVPPHGTLRKETAADSTITGLTLTTAIIQPTLTRPDLAGHWGGIPVAKLLITGRRAIDHRAGGKVLSGPFFGPRRYSRAVDPNPYNQRATPAIREGVRLTAQRWAAGAIRDALGSVA